MPITVKLSAKLRLVEVIKKEKENRNMKKEVKEVNLNLGCGVHFFKNFINIDNTFSYEQISRDVGKKGTWFENAVIESGSGFMKADMRKLPFKDNSVDYIECLAALEHIPFEGVPDAVKEMHRVLKPRHQATVTVPDFDDIALLWQEYIRYIPGKEGLSERSFNYKDYFKMVEVIFGNQISSGEYHRAAFNPLYVDYLFKKCGFKKFTITVYPRGGHPPRFEGRLARKPGKGKGFLVTQTLLIEAIK